MTTNPGMDELAPLVLALSLEERLRHVRECCRLLADFFSLQAEAAFVACQVPFSTHAYNALSTVCRAAADDLENLVRDMPPSIANWHGESAVVDRI